MGRKREKNAYKPRIRSRSEILVTGFFLWMIIIGALILMLPISSSPGKETTFLEAMFTATTSVCVTGSTVVDTSTHWSLFGQFVILCLIQAGGLGAVSVVAFLTLALRRELSMSEVVRLQTTFSMDGSEELSHFIRKFFLWTIMFEGAGAFLYSFVFVPQFGFLKGMWYSIFNAVSAFANAGLCVASSESLAPYRENGLVMTVTMLLIILGGVGFFLWRDVRNFFVSWVVRGRNLKYSLNLIGRQARLVIGLTAFFVFGGAVVIAFMEWSNPQTIGSMDTDQKLVNALFQSVTFRTAGFTTFSQDGLREDTCLIGALMMFVGGSPLGTAGGVKTVTILIVMMNVYAFLRNENEVTLLKRRVGEGVIRKATAIVTVQFMFLLTFCLALMIASDVSFTDALFEVASALSTVGLSRDITTILNVPGQWIEIIAMFCGRIGMIGMLLFFQPKSVGHDGIRHAEGRYIVG